MKVFSKLGFLFVGFCIALTSCTSPNTASKEETPAQEEVVEPQLEVLPEDQAPANGGETPQNDSNQDVIENDESEVMEQ